jgi:Domain of unknown function (DUF4331)
MKNETKRHLWTMTWGVGVGVMALAGFASHKSTATNDVYASDHLDSPQVAQDRAADIGDNYAFLDPNDNNMVVLMMTTQNFIVSSEHFGMAIFDSNLRYRFEIENTGDATPDTFVDVTYSPGLGRQTGQTATIVLPDGSSFSAPTTPANQEIYPTSEVSPNGAGPSPQPIITTDPVSGAKFFAGAVADPFFLDDTGANLTVASANANPRHPQFNLLSVRGGRDTYAGFNTLLTAVELPVSMLKGKSNIIGVNAVTQRQRHQVVTNQGTVVASGNFLTVDRDGNPLVNNGLIPPDMKNAYNGATTADDASGRFLPFLRASLDNFATDATHQKAILAIIQKNGDILRLNLKVPNSGPGGGTNSAGGFANGGGRRLQDDVVDMVFTLLHNGIATTDLVNNNPLPFRDEFPFAHDPYQPFPAGTVSDDTQQ